MPKFKTICQGLIIFILGAYLSVALAIPVSAAVNPYEKLGMSSACLNSSNGKFVAGKSENQVLPLASLTKLMTAIVLMNQKINLTKKVKITAAEVAYTKPYVEAGDVTSQIDLRAGDQVTKNDLWNAMLIASSNEAAIALVDNSGLTRAQFVKKMNSQAKALGLKHTKFTEPSGIDPKNVGTAKEMAIIARKAYSYLNIRSVSAKPSYSFKDLKSGRKVWIVSRNNSLLAMKPLGMKVGYLTEAKINVAARLKKGKKDRIIVVLHAVNNARRNQEISRLLAK